MVAMAILAIALGAVFSSEAGSVRMAARARKLGSASILVRCKMGEIEEQIAKEGFPAVFDEGEDNCCEGAEIQGFTCKWEIEPVSMPDEMFESEDGEGEGGEATADGKAADKKVDAKGLGEATSALPGADPTKKLDPAELLKDPKKLLGGGSTPGMGGLGTGMGMGMGAGESEGGGAPDMDAIAS